MSPSEMSRETPGRETAPDPDPLLFLNQHNITYLRVLR